MADAPFQQRKRLRYVDLPDTVLGERHIKVSNLWGQGIVVVDPARQDGVSSDRVRIWRLRSNTEADVIVSFCDFAPPERVAFVAAAARGYAYFLVHGPAPSDALLDVEPRYTYTEHGEILPEWDGLWDGDDPDWVGGVQAGDERHPEDYDEDPDDAVWKD